MYRFRLVVPVLLALGAAVQPQIANAQMTVGVTVTVPPPVLPVYDQPEIPGSGYMWVPGYWAWGPDGYFWVPGTWVLPPAVGLLWTPAYWSWVNGTYVFVPGYWGPQVGYYGGINYGYGYYGSGYAGGYWRNGAFFYNRAVNNFGHEHIVNFYNRPVANRQAFGRVSFNGGHGGTIVRPTAQQETFAHQSHTGLTPLQMQHQQAAAGNRALWDSQNHGRPPIAASSRPATFNTGVVPAHNAAQPQRPAPGPATVPHNGAPAFHPAGQAAQPPAPHVVQPTGPAPQYHAAPAPQYHPAPAPQAHPAPQYHPAPAPAPQFHPAPAPQAAPHEQHAPPPQHDDRQHPGN